MDEDDGYDETLIPVDYASAGQIRDDDLYESLVSAMPEGSTLVSLMDCCHSATVLDLPYKYQATSDNSFRPGLGDLAFRNMCMVIILAMIICAALLLTLA